MNINELLLVDPKVSIVIVAFLITLFMTLITKKFTDQERMRELKENQKKLQQKIKDAQGDTKEIAEINKELMGSSMELMKHSFKPMLFTFIPLLLLFWWIKGIYSPVLSGWIWWYLVAGLISSIALRKALKVV